MAHNAHPDQAGFIYWGDKVLTEHAKVGTTLSDTAVHDLRVALRRCNTISSVMCDLDPGSDWRKLRKAGKTLFKRLGALRDTQVLSEWIGRLGTPGESSTEALREVLRLQYAKNRVIALQALQAFDCKQWRSCVHRLAVHFRQVATNRVVCESLVLDNWAAVSAQHRRAQKSQSRTSYHQLRIGLKKFRYISASFMPSMYAQWEPDLKFLQDLLGEIHDLDVLTVLISRDRHLAGTPTQAAWMEKIKVERETRLRAYRKRMARKDSPLRLWREQLPVERELRSVGLARLAMWAEFVTPDFAYVRRTAGFALQLFDGLSNQGVVGVRHNFEERIVLHAAALLREVGRFAQKGAHHKESYRMICKLEPPTGWTKRDVELVALVARFHRKAVPDRDHKALTACPPRIRESVVLLAAILRFANAFKAKKYRSVRRLEPVSSTDGIVIRLPGFIAGTPVTTKLSDARRLLEFACGRPVHLDTPAQPAPKSQPARRALARSDAA